MRNLVFLVAIAGSLLTGKGLGSLRAQEFLGDQVRIGSSPREIARPGSVIQEDASLHAVQFLDADHGWAVGDHGVILATVDGGRNWRQQISGTQASLRQISFRSLMHGVAVGGWYQADTGLSHGVILKTDDGGKTWTPVPHDLPALMHVGYQADGTLVVGGNWSTKHLGRIFSWSSALGDWQVVDSGDAVRSECLAGIVEAPIWADAQGVIFQMHETVAADSTALSVLPRVERIWSAGANVVASTRDSEVFISRDGARKWQGLGRLGGNQHDAERRSELNVVDPTAVAISDQGTIWVAGTPGDKIYRIDPEGHVSVGNTGEKTPIHDLCFLDEFRGWAVGAFGSILVTRDGGKTWRTQRNDDRRAMVLAVARTPKHLPWSAIAVESLEYGRRCAVVVEDRAAERDAGMQDPLAAEPLLQAAWAASQIGGGAALGWDSHDPSLGRLAAAIRATQPSVLVVGADVRGPMLDRLIEIAVELQVRRVFAVFPTKDRGDLVLFSSAVLPVAGHITGDLWEQALGIVAPRSTPDDRLNLRILWDAAANDTRLASLAEGLHVLQAQRAPTNGRRRNIQVLQARSNENAIIDRLFEQAAKHDLSQAKESLGGLLKQTPVDSRQRFLRTVIDRSPCGETGQALGAVVVYLAALELASEQFSDEGLGIWSAFRLQAIRHSLEWQHSLLAALPVSVPGDASSGAAPVAANRSPFERGESPAMRSGEMIQQSLRSDDSAKSFDLPPASHGSQTVLPVRPVSTFEESNQEVVLPVFSKANATLPGDSLWLNHPAVLFWRASDGVERLELWDQEAWRKLGLSQSAGLWRSLVDLRTARSLVARAVSSRGLVQRPLLDGVLDEPCWERTTLVGDRVSMSPSASEHGHPSNRLDLRIAYDSDFVYLGCQGIFDPEDQEDRVLSRRRDEDLRGNARVCFEIDTDRDLQTRYRLTVDRQGRTRDSCDGFLQWQPRWYVATRLEGRVRTVEIAIHREDLVQLPAVSGDKWRIRPTVLAAHQSDPPVMDASPRGWIEVQME